MLRLQKMYKEQIAPALMKQMAYQSVMQVPKLDKVVINMGVGDATSDIKKLERAVEEITQITGQKPVITKSKKSIATFKLRQDQGIGVKVTLRNDRMWAFVDKLFTVALPRVRDFRGTTVNAFDGRGNYTLGVKEQIIFAEVDYDKVQKIRGFDVTFVTSTNDDEAAKALLTMLGMPFGRAAPTSSPKAESGEPAHQETKTAATEEPVPPEAPKKEEASE